MTTDFTLYLTQCAEEAGAQIDSTGPDFKIRASLVDGDPQAHMLLKDLSVAGARLERQGDTCIAIVTPSIAAAFAEPWQACDICGAWTKNTPSIVGEKSGPHVADSGDIYEILCDDCKSERAEIGERERDAAED